MERLHKVALAGLILIFGLWANYYFNNARANEDPTSAPDLAAATRAAQPVLEALEKYHAANGFYPVTLDQLTTAGFIAHLPEHGRRHGFLYSGDWVYKSDACAAREKPLHGWILKEVKEYQRQIDEFKQERVTGYREYQLQSGDFPRAAQSQQNIERWAYFDSNTRQWRLGWCAATGKSNQEIGTNGICRWRQRDTQVVW
jgi:hypothetical protein